MDGANDNYVNSPHPAANMEDLEVNNEDLDDSFVATTAPTHGLQDVDGLKEDASHKLSPHGNLIYGSGSKVDPFQIPVHVGPSDNISTSSLSSLSSSGFAYNKSKKTAVRKRLPSKVLKSPYLANKGGKRTKRSLKYSKGKAHILFLCMCHISTYL
jgi:hypothetical protein